MSEKADKKAIISLDMINTKLHTIKEMVAENYSLIHAIAHLHPATSTDKCEDEKEYPGTIIGNMNHIIEGITEELMGNNKFLREIHEWAVPK